MTPPEQFKTDPDFRRYLIRIWEGKVPINLSGISLRSAIEEAKTHQKQDAYERMY